MRRWLAVLFAVLLRRDGRALNRLLLDASELRGRVATLPLEDRRAQHVAKAKKRPLWGRKT